MRWLLFSSAGILVYLSFCFYIGIKLYALICYYNQNFKRLKKIVFWIPFAVFCCAMAASENLAVSRTAGLVWMVFAVWLSILFILTDVIRLVLFLLKKRVEGINAYMTAEAIFLCVVLVIFGIFNARSIHTKHYDITLKGEGDRLRIVLISDLHIGSTIGESWVSRYAAAINKAKPDMVCIAGDIFDRHIGSVEDAGEIIALLKTINAPLGVFACLGNHDRDRTGGAAGSTARIANILKTADINVLQDEVYEAREKLFVAGRRDARHVGVSHLRRTPQALLEGFDGTVIVLDHQPTEYPLLEQAGADLILSGHTHRGQIYPAGIITYFLYKKAGGAHYGYWKGEKAQAVITSGAGYWGPPIRIGTRSEIAVINIKFMPN
jgi:predicted MPP superfamily phosphohydrolase